MPLQLALADASLQLALPAGVVVADVGAVIPDVFAVSVVVVVVAAADDDDADEAVVADVAVVAIVVVVVVGGGVGVAAVAAAENVFVRANTVTRCLNS